MNIGGAWHSDHTYDQIQARGSILLARDVPPPGGDTRFADVGDAYEALSPKLALKKHAHALVRPLSTPTTIKSCTATTTSTSSSPSRRWSWSCS